jgi:Notch-like protein
MFDICSFLKSNVFLIIAVITFYRNANKAEYPNRRQRFALQSCFFLMSCSFLNNFGLIAVCPDGTFGNDCLQNCTCAVGSTLSCDTVTGACNCKSGWTGSQCSNDIDECRDPAVHQCPDNSQCVNTQGSFYCSCDVGYIKSGNGSCQGKLQISL